MDNAKSAYRETEETGKEAWRNRDGEDLADKVGNLGDDIRKELGDAGDALKRTGDNRGNPIDDPDVAPTDPYRPA